MDLELQDTHSGSESAEDEGLEATDEHKEDDLCPSDSNQSTIPCEANATATTRRRADTCLPDTAMLDCEVGPEQLVEGGEKFLSEITISDLGSAFKTDEEDGPKECWVEKAVVSDTKILEVTALKEDEDSVGIDEKQEPNAAFVSEVAPHIESHVENPSSGPIDGTHGDSSHSMNAKISPSIESEAVSDLQSSTSDEEKEPEDPSVVIENQAVAFWGDSPSLTRELPGESIASVSGRNLTNEPEVQAAPHHKSGVAHNGITGSSSSSDVLHSGTSNTAKIGGNGHKFGKSFQVVHKGLTVILQNQSHRFSYALIPNDMDGSSSFERLRLKEEVEISATKEEFMLFYELQEASTKQSMKMKVTKYLKAVLFVNTEDHYRLSRDLIDTVKGKFRNSLVFLVNNSDGAKIKLYKHNNGKYDTYVAVEVETSVDIKEPDDFVSTVSSLMYSCDGPVVLTNDVTKFVNAFSTLFQSKEDWHGFVDGIVIFRDHMNAVLGSDFPFYILLVNRIIEKKGRIGLPLYKKKYEEFVREFVESMEDLPITDLAETLLSFVRQKDFILTGDENGVFFLLEKSCLTLATESHLLNYRKLTERANVLKFLYRRMRWISLSMAFRQAQEIAGSMNAHQVWVDYFISVDFEMKFDYESIVEFERGINIGHQLQLSSDLCFSGQCFYDLIGGEKQETTKTIWTFDELRSFFDLINKHSSSPELMMIILSSLLQHYDTMREKQGRNILKSLSAEKTLRGSLKDGINFLDGAYSMSIKNTMDIKKVQESIQNWLKFLLHLIDIAGRDATFFNFFFDRECKVLSDNFSTISGAIVNMVQEKFGELDIRQFFPLYKELKKFNIWPLNFIGSFLDVYVIPNDIVLSDITWTDFFKDITREFKSARHHYYLKSFLKATGLKYLDQARVVNFIIDLLNLGVSKLLSGSTNEDKKIRDDFCRFLYEIIIANDYRDKLCQKIAELIQNDSLNIHVDDKFQSYIWEFLYTVLVSDENGTLPTGFSCLLKQCVSTLNNDSSWKLNTPNPKQNCCLQIIANCCSKILIEKESLEWANRYKNIIINVCQLYSHSDSALHQPVDTRRIIFEKIASIPLILHTWKEKFAADNVTYQEIKNYLASQKSLMAIASKLGVSSSIVQFADKFFESKFLSMFENLNSLLLCFIRERPDIEWCSLPALLQKYDLSLPNECMEILNQKINYNGQIPDDDLGMEISSTVGKSFPFDGDDISLRLHKNATLKELSTVVKILTSDNMSSLIQLKEMLIFFTLLKCSLFEKYINYFVKKNELEYDGEITMNRFIFALKEAESLISKVIQGAATYSEIFAEDKTMLQHMNARRDFKIFREYAVMKKISSTKGLDHIDSVLELFQYLKCIKNVCEVCEQYTLYQDDPNVKKLQDILICHENIEDSFQITPHEAADKVKEVKKLLCMGKKTDPHCLDIFEAMRDSTEFYQFIRDNHFDEEEGQVRFQQQYQLVVAQLQHEEYNEQVLNHLFVAFKVISPFVKKNSGFKDLIKEITHEGAVRGLAQLKTVNRNITLIKLWFFRAEGETLENVAVELECIISTGHYTFHFQDDNIDLPYKEMGYQILLEYEAISTKSPSSTTHLLQEPVSKARREKWASEQISDFVRKLGFLDTDESQVDVEGNIRKFLYLDQTISTLLKLYSTLRELGHPDYFSAENISCIACSTSKEEIDSIVEAAEKTVLLWKDKLSNLRRQYAWLLYFSIPKMLQLYKVVCHPDDQSDIFNEISFLVRENPQINKIKKKIKKVLLKMLGDSDNAVPMKIVGKFLSYLFHHHTLPRRCSVQTTTGTHSSHLCYLCPNYSQIDFLRLIFGIFNGIPESYQVLYCHATTTLEQLELFLKRAENHKAHYLMLNVNQLPFKLQEHLIQVHLAMRSQQLQSKKELCSTLHFLETARSMLDEMPWIEPKDPLDNMLPLQEAEKMCKDTILSNCDFMCIKVVHGAAGIGKTHYIKRKLAKKCSKKITIAVNEVFTPLSAIIKLRTLPSDTKKIGLYFNFTILPPGNSVTEKERQHYDEMKKQIGWFFFNLLILGYVEDARTGLSFCIPEGLQWAVYIEVPSRNSPSHHDSFLQMFYSEFPALQLLGSSYCVKLDVPFVVDSDVQLVCKYLRAYDQGPKVIDRLYSEGSRLVKFSTGPDLFENECRDLLDRFMPNHVKSSKIMQQLFIRYMKRRCEFLDTLPFFNYNFGRGEYKRTAIGRNVPTDTTALGSTLMQTMISEVTDFCDPSMMENWSFKPHQQLIYDFKDGGGSFELISLNPEKIKPSDRKKYLKMGFEILPMSFLKSRDHLDKYLARALNLKLNEKERLTIIDESNYVLTLDYTVKMLNIHERFKCGIPVIIEGETGVGKTALIEMLSKLWNQSFVLGWENEKSIIKEFFRKMVTSEDRTMPEASVDVIKTMDSDNISMDSLVHLCKDCGQLVLKLKSLLLRLKQDPLTCLLDVNLSGCSLLELIKNVEDKENPESIATFLYAVFTAKIKPMFHKFNIHSALTPMEIKKKLDPVFCQAQYLIDTFQKSASQESMCEFQEVPFVTVFLDEINTSSCLGLFKEIIVDKCLDGRTIPPNVFIVAACNPHRGNSLAVHQSWVRGTYYVRPLHPTLRLLMWDYGSLDEHQERDYIMAKMKISNKAKSTEAHMLQLTDLVVESQKLMREFAFMQLSSDKAFPSRLEEIACRSCVSQRDIQRVFVFYEWLMNMHYKTELYKSSENHQRAVIVSLGLVYYLRLNAKFRDHYKFRMDQVYKGQLTFSKTFERELNYFISNVDLPQGIAHTSALKENIFATIVCTATRTPLIMVGAPGSSKTLSFNQVIANLKGPESKMPLFRNTDVFHALDPQYYQCSRRTTSNEIETIFSRAIHRQDSHVQAKLPIYCVVFMDEAGLPEESHESLKVLHYYLDRQEVSFVAITNHMLDAAKTNRAISLFRPETSDEDLKTLAKGCFFVNSKETRTLKNEVEKLHLPYLNCMNDTSFSKFFGLRDFIQFVNYLSRFQGAKGSWAPKTVMHALERNFNGFDKFESICEIFFSELGISIEEGRRHKRNILQILKESLLDRKLAVMENEVRYKLFIDPSEDESLVRLLFTVGLLKHDQATTRMFVCSDFPGDGELEKINTIAAIRHSAIQGHTVVMSQTDDIHDSFYELFNQRFRCIDDPNPENPPRYYTNIAIGAHLKPSRVDPNFQCVVVVKKSEVDLTPAPFLNRFEKYFISHSSLLDAMLHNLSPCIAVMIQVAKKKVQELLCYVEENESLYGLQPETLDSLILCLLPTQEFEYKDLEISPVNSTDNIRTYFFQEVLQSYRQAGFHIPSVVIETERDAAHLFDLIEEDYKFNGLLKNMSHEDAKYAIVEAFNKLHKTKAFNEMIHVSASETCMAISIMQQFLIMILTKRLIHLMTPESVILNNGKIPLFYLECYLLNQAHFCLKDVISNYHKDLEEIMPNYLKNPNKLLCYTRSSSLIHALPNHFSCSTKGNTELISTLVFDEPKKLFICKLSGFASQSSLKDLLTKFVRSRTAEVCIFLANMQETSVKIINHIRVMIEEQEVKMQESQSKLFVVLLHFPPSQFYQHCYPALFLKGWDHCYLDSIAPKTAEEIVDIQDWFHKSCFSQPQESIETDMLLNALKELLSQSISVLSARTYFGKKKDGSFNSSMNALDRSKALEYILNDRGVGQVLIMNFHKYWNPKMMSEYLVKAAMFSKRRESTLHIADSIQARLKALFMDYCVFMLTRANENYNLDIVYRENSDTSTHKFFIEILTHLDFPNLELLHLHNKKDQFLPGLKYSPQFPFFKDIYSAIEKQIELTREKVNQQLNFLDNSGLKNQPSKLQVFLEAVIKDLEQLMKSPNEKVLSIALQRITADSQLWYYYFNDFITYKLRLLDQSVHTSSKTALNQWLLQTFSDFKLPELKNIVKLHCHLSLNLAQMASILRPLNKIEQLHHSFVSCVYQAGELQHVSELKDHHFGDLDNLFSFVLNVLFSGLVGTLKFSQLSTKDTLKLWFESYRDIMSLHSFKQFAYSLLSVSKMNSQHNTSLIEAMMNIMFAVFIIIDSSTILNDKWQQVFVTLIQQYLNDEMKLKQPGSYPNMEVITKVIMSAVDSSVQKKVMNGVMSHFFSLLRPDYHEADVLWFLQLVNNQKHWCLEESSDSQVKYEIEMLKFHLHTICCCYKGSKKAIFKNQLFLPYHESISSLIGKVLMFNENLGPPEPYQPLYYQEVLTQSKKKRNRMNQPLCHLYFLTAMEHLCSDDKISKFVLMIEWLDEVKGQFDQDKGGEAVMLRLEYQAVIEVTINQLALHLKDPHKQSDVLAILDKINNVLDNIASHGMVLSHQLLKKYNSSRRFILVMKEESLLFNKIGCLEQLDPKLQLAQNKTVVIDFKQHLFQLQPERNLETLYIKLKSIMVRIHRRAGQEGELIELARKHCEQGSKQLESFRMVLWLVTYHEFFENKISSDILGTTIDNEVMRNYLQGEAYVHFIRSFLQPRLMLNVIESLSTEATTSCKRNMIFDPSINPDDLDQSEFDLRQTLVYLVAVVLGSPSKKCHLWFHLFGTDQLENTFMTGTMCDDPVSPDGVLYDQRIDTLLHGHFIEENQRKRYSMHSLHVLLWANFGAFCISLLTQPESNKQLCGHVIAKSKSVKRYCLSMLHDLWEELLGVGHTEEQRLFFLQQMIGRIYQYFSKLPSDNTEGTFKTFEELDSYEKIWHLHVYKPTWEDHNQMAKIIQHHEGNCKLFDEIRNLDKYYPHFPTEKELTNYVLNSDEYSKKWFLVKFCLEWQRLIIGGSLLPDLIELYNWFDRNLAHLLTFERASSIKIGEVISHATKNSGKEFGEHIKQLYFRVQDNFNHYVVLTNKMMHPQQYRKLVNEAPLIHYLTDVEEFHKGNDSLFIVIADIISLHNSLVQQALSNSECDIQLLPGILPTEVTVSNAIVSNFTESHGMNSFTKLLRRNFSVPSGPFNLEKLEEDVVLTFFQGKHLIESPLTNLRKIFKFKKDKTEDLNLYEHIHIKDMSENLTDVFKISLSSELNKRFECEFHLANHDIMMEVATALRSVINYLVKTLQEGVNCEALEKATVQEFMLKQYECDCDIWRVLGISNTTKSQLACLIDLPLVATYSCLLLFFHWMDDGYYDYCSLPFHFKMHLSDKAEISMEKAVSQVESKLVLLENLQTLVQILKQSEKDITCQVNETLNKPILEFLIEAKKMDTNDPVYPYLPSALTLHHYVQFRIYLRRIILKLQSELSLDNKDNCPEAVWNEFVPELWTKHFPHLREKYTAEELAGDGNLVYDAARKMYGFQEGCVYDSVSEFEAALLTDDIQEHYINEGAEAKSDDFVIIKELPETVTSQNKVPEIQVDKPAIKLPSTTDNQLLEESSLKEQPKSEIADRQPMEESLSQNSVQQAMSDEQLAQEFSSHNPVFTGEVLDSQSINDVEESPSEKSLQAVLVQLCIEECIPDQSSPEIASYTEASVSESQVLFSEKSSLSLIPQNSPVSQLQNAEDTFDQEATESETLVDLQFLASSYNPKALSEFLLNELQLLELSEDVLDQGITGDTLLDADLEADFEVSSPLLQLKIKHLLKKKLLGSTVKYSKEDLCQFLDQYNLFQFSTDDINGDMILEENEQLVCRVLKELGVKSYLQQVKIVHLYKRHKLKGSIIKYPVDHVVQFLNEYKLDKYISKFTDNEIDGDMLLEVNEKLMKEVLKEVGIKNIQDRSMILTNYKKYLK